MQRTLKKKKMVRRLCLDSKVPGICVGTRAAVAPGLAPAAGYREESYYIRSFPYQSRGCPPCFGRGGRW